MEMKEEIWKDIEGYEGLYKISNKGRVLSCKKYKYHLQPKELYLKAGLSGGNYYTVSLSKNLKRYTHYIHKLIANAFIPNPNNYKWINHIDGNKLNNDISNLEWCTPSENNNHAYRTGLRTAIKGEEKWSCKLKETDVKEIRVLFKQGVERKTLSKNFNISYSLICAILQNRKWKI